MSDQGVSPGMWSPEFENAFGTAETLQALAEHAIRVIEIPTTDPHDPIMAEGAFRAFCSLAKALTIVLADAGLKDGHPLKEKLRTEVPSLYSMFQLLQAMMDMYNSRSTIPTSRKRSSPPLLSTTTNRTDTGDPRFLAAVLTQTWGRIAQAKLRSRATQFHAKSHHVKSDKPWKLKVHHDTFEDLIRALKARKLCIFFGMTKYARFGPEATQPLNMKEVCLPCWNANCQTQNRIYDGLLKENPHLVNDKWLCMHDGTVEGYVPTGSPKKPMFDLFMFHHRDGLHRICTDVTANPTKEELFVDFNRGVPEGCEVRILGSTPRAPALVLSFGRERVPSELEASYPLHDLDLPVQDFRNRLFVDAKTFNGKGREEGVDGVWIWNDELNIPSFVVPGNYPVLAMDPVCILGNSWLIPSTRRFHANCHLLSKISPEFFKSRFVIDKMIANHGGACSVSMLRVMPISRLVSRFDAAEQNKTPTPSVLPPISQPHNAMTKPLPPVIVKALAANGYKFVSPVLPGYSRPEMPIASGFGMATATSSRSFSEDEAESARDSENERRGRSTGRNKQATSLPYRVV